MGNLLRDRRTAAELASVGQVIEFTDKISSFGGLTAIVGADLAALDPARMPPDWRDGGVSGQLQFGFADDAGRIPMVSGNAAAHIDAVCQRCLEPFQLTVNVEPRLLLLDGGQGVAGYEEFEVWELDGPDLRPQDIVEELLIMAMPFSAMHDRTDECKAFFPAEASDDEGVKGLRRPFAALRSQMTQNKMDSD